MSATRDTRINHITATADLALVAAGTTVISKPSGAGSGAVKNVRHGQLVVFDPETGLAVDDSNISGYANSDRLVFGVGIDTSGKKNMANQIRRSAGDEFFGCTLNYINAQAPVCGTPHIQDIFFKCIQPNESYAIKISWDDYLSRSTEPWNRDPHVTATHYTQAGDCDDCNVAYTCDKLACGLIDDFKNNLEDIDWDWAGLGGNNAPLKMVRLFAGGNTSKVFCITPDDTTCEDCATTEAINRFQFDPDGQGTQNYDLENSVDPADSSVTLLTQLENIVDQINDVIAENGNGYAVLTKGVGKCCEYQIHVNTCDVNFALGEWNGVETFTALVPCTNEDPTATVNLPVTCGSCSQNQDTQTWTCGVRLIADPVVVECGCYGANPLPVFFGRNINVQAVGDGWSKASTYVREYQAMSLPENFGAQVYEQEYRSSNGGFARTHDDWTDLVGPKMAHRANGRSSAPLANCDDSYCTWDIGHLSPHSQYGIDGTVNPVPMVTVVAIPDKATTAKASWEAFLAAYITELGPKCPKVNSVDCADSYNLNGRRV
jgi:hypothetical protein